MDLRHEGREPRREGLRAVGVPDARTHFGRSHGEGAQQSPISPHEPSSANTARLDVLVEQVAKLANATAAVAKNVGPKEVVPTVSLKETISQVSDGVARRQTRDEVVDATRVTSSSLELAKGQPRKKI